MSAQRVRASSHNAGSHSISLKVLRLSKPSLAPHTPLSKTDFGNGLDLDTRASLACPSSDGRSSFPISHVLTLPSSFGLAYVGERFACTLCANNELEDSSSNNKSVSSVKVSAELQTPSQQQGTPLELETRAHGDGGAFDLQYGETLQLNLQHELKDVGPHVLAVTVTYTETTHQDQGDASGGRVRTFRKLYQFMAQQLISIRSKVTERDGRKAGIRQWLVEAQLENVGENSVMLENVKLQLQDGVVDVDDDDKHVESTEKAVSLKPQDIQQVMFRVRELSKADTVAKRQLGQIIVKWRGQMGETGRLTTGWLTSKT